MQIETICHGTDKDGQEYQFCHDGSKALLFTYNGQKWDFLSRGNIRPLLKFSHGFGIKWDNPGKIRDLLALREVTKPERLRKRMEHDVRLAPYRTPAQAAYDD